MRDKSAPWEGEMGCPETGKNSPKTRRWRETKKVVGENEVVEARVFFDGEMEKLTYEGG